MHAKAFPQQQNAIGRTGDQGGRLFRFVERIFMNNPQSDFGTQVPKPKHGKPKLWRRVFSLVLAALITLSPVAALFASPTSAYGAAMNSGDPFTNGDMVLSQAAGPNGSGYFWILGGGAVTVTHGSTQSDSQGYYPAGSSDGSWAGNYPIVQDVGGNCSSKLSSGAQTLMYVWSDSPAGSNWGQSDFTVNGLYANYGATTTCDTAQFLINHDLNIGGVDLASDILHCIDPDRGTLPNDLQCGAALALYSMSYDASTGIYTGQFNLVLSMGGTYQAAASKDLITVTWQNTGTIKITKTSSNVSLSSSNDCYSLDGATYGIYPTSADASKDTNLIQSLTLSGDSNSSSATSGDLVPGSYYLKETKAATGYALDTSIYPVTVSGGQESALDVTDTPQNDPAAMWVGKVDAETTDNMPLGSASLAGAQFEIRYYDGYYSASTLPTSADRTWIVKTDEDGYAQLKDSYKVSGDDFFYASTGGVTAPLGTLAIQEVKAPEGYLLGDQPTFIRQITSTGYITEAVQTYNAPVAPEQVVRGDLELIKAAAVTYERMANIPFAITSKTTGESHTIVTDANGFASTASAWNPHSQDTNEGTSPNCGVWFGLDAKGTSAPVDDAKGALPYDSYIIAEQACAGNQGRDLIPPFEVTISRDNYTVNLGTLTDQWTPAPEIGTTAKDKDSNTQQACAVGQTTIVDTVAYKNLNPGQSYTLSGHLVDQSSEATLTVGEKAVAASKTFTPSTADGSIDIEFPFDATGLGGHNVVAFESLSQNGKEVASHADINDGGQTVLLVAPEIHTTATEKGSGAKSVYADIPVTITDEVAYSNLVANRSYSIAATLMDKATGKPVVVDGSQVRATKNFTAQNVNGVVDVDLTFDARTLGGHAVVVFENLTRDGVFYAAHADINDSGQSVTVIPASIHTQAHDKKTGLNKTAGESSVTITDEVAYQNLAIGKTYTVSGVLMDKSTDATLTVGNHPVISTKEFVPTTTDGTVELEYSFDAAGLGGRSIVVFEKLYQAGVEVASHADINDRAQTVFMTKPLVTKTSLPKTGDSTELGFLALIAGVAVGLLVARLLLGLKKAKKNKKRKDADKS